MGSVHEAFSKSGVTYDRKYTQILPLRQLITGHSTQAIFTKCKTDAYKYSAAGIEHLTTIVLLHRTSILSRRY